jgi:hypothetical protein
MTLAVLALAYAGLVALALAMDRHHAQAFGHHPGPARRAGLRLVGGALLLCAFLAATARSASIGAVEFFVTGSVAAMLAALLFPYAPRLAAALAAIAAPIGGLAMMLGG